MLAHSHAPLALVMWRPLMYQNSWQSIQWFKVFHNSTKMWTDWHCDPFSYAASVAKKDIWSQAMWFGSNWTSSKTVLSPICTIQWHLWAVYLNISPRDIQSVCEKPSWADIPQDLNSSFNYQLRSRQRKCQMTGYSWGSSCYGHSKHASRFWDIKKKKKKRRDPCYYYGANNLIRVLMCLHICLLQETLASLSTSLQKEQ